MGGGRFITPQMIHEVVAGIMLVVITLLMILQLLFNSHYMCIVTLSVHIASSIGYILWSSTSKPFFHASAVALGMMSVFFFVPIFTFGISVMSGFTLGVAVCFHTFMGVYSQSKHTSSVMTSVLM